MKCLGLSCRQCLVEAGSWSCGFSSHFRQSVDHPVRRSQVSHPSLRPPFPSALESLSLFSSLLTVKRGSKKWENAPFFSRDWMETWGCFCLNLSNPFQTGGLRLSITHPYPTLSCSSLGLCHRFPGSFLFFPPLKQISVSPKERRWQSPRVGVDGACRCLEGF